jgi:aspartate kinase
MGLGEAQRAAIRGDRRWADGRYDPNRPPLGGLAIARMIAMCSYRSPESFRTRFGRERTENDLFQVESYLRHQGGKLGRRFDANSYMTLSRAMDSHDLARGRGSLRGVLAGITQPTLVIGIQSDVLYLPEEIRELASGIPGADLQWIDSPHGHDAFLIEQDQVNDAVVRFRSPTKVPIRPGESFRVMKFGGTSLSTADRVETVCGLIQEAAEEERVVVVTSAPAGVTDLLLEVVEEGSENRGVAEGNSEEPATSHAMVRLEDLVWKLAEESSGKASRDGAGSVPRLETGVATILSEIEGLAARSRRLGAWVPALRDRVLAAGERLSALLLSCLLESRGTRSESQDAERLIRTDSNFGAALVNREETDRLIQNRLTRLPEEIVSVVPGFTGGDTFHRTTTLGRGTSDLTATLIGAALSARVVEIWTDVDGIFTSDPAECPDAPLLPQLDYDEAREMARRGANVLHPDTLEPIIPLRIPLRVRNTLRPESPGTRVGPAKLNPAPNGGREERTAAAHPIPILEPPTIAHLILAGGTGRVAGALLSQLEGLAPRLLEERGLEIRVGAAFTSRAEIRSTEGFPPGEVKARILRGLAPDWERIREDLGGGRFENPIFVDLTASSEVANRYLQVLQEGVPVVTANKLAMSGRYSEYRSLRAASVLHGAPLRFETAVGAALPILGAVRARRLSGDTLQRVEAVLSGTLSFVFAKLCEGLPFSRAVEDAMKAGFTEPDPRQDLSGSDVARKLLILLREAGSELEPGDIPVESLVPPELGEISDPREFIRDLAAHDDLWVERMREARKEGGVLGYTASFEGWRAFVGPRVLAEDHPLAILRATENGVLLWTDQYPQVPLSIGGPGAGPRVTASGVLSDILSAVSERYWTGTPLAPSIRPRPRRDGRGRRRVA